MRILPLLIAATLSFGISLNAQPTADSIKVPPGAQLILHAKGDGAQVYTCSNTPDGVKWILKAPDAKLLNDSGIEIGSHFAGPTWKLTDGSQVQADLVATQPATEPDSVPWLLLRAKTGTATGKLANAAWIRRTRTRGGTAPKTGCTNPAQAGAITKVPYTANYDFYSK